MILIKNKYAYFNIKNFLNYLNMSERHAIKNHLVNNMEKMSKKETDKFMNFLNSITKE